MAVMTTLLIYVIVGLIAIGAFLVAAFVVTLNKMVTDEMRARLDDIPAVLVALALRLAPADRRDFLRADWVDNLLVAFDEKNARYPVSRILRSLPFVLPLFGTATVLRGRARAVRRQAEQDEKLERLAVRPVGIGEQVVRPAGIDGGGQVDVVRAYVQYGDDQSDRTEQRAAHRSALQTEKHSETQRRDIRVVGHG
jgi:hypothetical protein